MRTGDLSFAKEKGLLSHDIRIRNWLEAIGVYVKADYTTDTIEEFRSGTLLCQIIAAVEGHPLKGIYTDPKTSAEAIQNIRRVFDKVSAKRALPSRFSRAERDILRGDGEVIRDFLLYLSKYYRDRTTMIKKLKHRNETSSQLV
jgi:hypothetical protein